MSAKNETSVQPPVSEPGRLQRLISWARRVEIERGLAALLLTATLFSGVATYLAMTDRLPTLSDPSSILLLLILDLGLLLGFGGLIIRRLVILWIERRRASAGARLHSRLVGLFSLVAVAPSLIIAVFSVLFFEVGLQGWFNERVSTAVKESLTVAQAYLQEHRQTINADALAMAQDLNRAGPGLALNQARLNQILNTQVALRSLTEVMIFEGSGRVLGKAGFSLLLDFDPEIPTWAIDRAAQGDVVSLTAETDDRVRALVRLEAWPNTYLFVGRLVDPRVLGHMELTSDAVRLYEQLEGERSGLVITFALVFVLVALLLLVAAAWVGLAFANRLSKPIGSLIVAAERVRAGDLAARVSGTDKDDEVGTLARTFNRMTGELERQQHELIEANQQIEDRRRFIEAVLSGVSAGILGLDKDGAVTLSNRSACELLSLQPEQLRGRRLSMLSRDMRELLAMAEKRPGRVHERQITLDSGEGSSRTFLVRVVAERDAQEIIGYVVTFDDITELLSAQRKAAWADVARRIAHEIKNPLTPIQLSAERLKRRYLKQIGEGQETFAACTDTIVRHVSDIGRMVDEFSNFARMPAPAPKPHDLRVLVEEALSLQRSAHHAIAFSYTPPPQAMMASVDAAQIRQALTNLLQNAVDSLEAHAEEKGAENVSLEVEVVLSIQDDRQVIDVLDRGRGLPQEQRERLTEPYVTTRARGTGLGLAIVRKIMEDHGGSIALADRDGGGARVSLIFPVLGAEPTATTDDAMTEGNRKMSAHGS